MKYIVVILGLAVLVSCKRNQAYTKMEQKVPKTEIKDEIHKIQVTEVIDGGNYVYLNVDEADKSYWMAIPSAEVTEGKTYYYEGGMAMKDFESKHLNKTFDNIIFVEGIRTTEQPSVDPNKPVSEEHVASSKGSAVMDIKIEKPKGGVSVVELLQNKADFSAKTVKVRGKVIKINNEIMDKNWVHISDGTTFDNKKSITVTTQEFVKLGDTVTFKGNLTLNKDFGHGYVYDLLLENGELID